MTQPTETASPTKMAQRTLNNLKRSHLYEYVDFRLYAKSEEMQLILAGAVDEAISKNSTTIAVAAYEAIRDDQVRKSFIQWFCLYTGFERKGALDPIKFTKSMRRPDPTVKFIAILGQNCPTGKITARHSSKRKLVRHMPVENPPPQDDGIDMLNHPARLPGSYGSGKRK